jgi:hypothetical protein
MRPFNTSAQSRFADRWCTEQLPVPSTELNHQHRSSSQQCQPYLAIPLLACAPDERAAGGEKSVADCQRPNDASNGTKTHVLRDR